MLVQEVRIITSLTRMLVAGYHRMLLDPRMLVRGYW